MAQGLRQRAACSSAVYCIQTTGTVNSVAVEPVSTYNMAALSSAIDHYVVSVKTLVKFHLVFVDYCIVFHGFNGISAERKIIIIISYVRFNSSSINTFIKDYIKKRLF